MAVSSPGRQRMAGAASNRRASGVCRFSNKPLVMAIRFRRCPTLLPRPQDRPEQKRTASRGLPLHRYVRAAQLVRQNRPIGSRQIAARPFELYSTEDGRSSATRLHRVRSHVSSIQPPEPYSHQKPLPPRPSPPAMIQPNAFYSQL